MEDSGTASCGLQFWPEYLYPEPYRFHSIIFEGGLPGVIVGTSGCLTIWNGNGMEMDAFGVICR